jgi:type VI protein secretion system component Hcp
MQRKPEAKFTEVATELTADELEGVSGGLKYLTYELTNALMSNYSTSAGGDRPSE